MTRHFLWKQRRTTPSALSTFTANTTSDVIVTFVKFIIAAVIVGVAVIKVSTVQFAKL